MAHSCFWVAAVSILKCILKRHDLLNTAGMENLLEIAKNTVALLIAARIIIIISIIGIALRLLYTFARTTQPSNKRKFERKRSFIRFAKIFKFNH